jgi:hypothetical protein
MFTGRKILVAWGAMALLALPLLAGQTFAGETAEKAKQPQKPLAAKASARSNKETHDSEKQVKKAVKARDVKVVQHAAEEADEQAGEDADEDAAVQKTSYSTARPRRGPGHVITIWRGGQPRVASIANRQDGQEAPPPPDAGQGQVPWESTPEEVSPFLDEPQHQHGGGCAGGCADGECTSGGCTSGCGSDCGGCGQCEVCLSGCAYRPWWAHRASIFAEYLYLHPSGIDMAHAIQQNGTGGAGTTPEGRVGVVDQDYNSAYRAGFAVPLSPCSSIQAAYANYHAHGTDSLAAPNVLGGTVASLVLHPGSVNAGSTSSLVDATNDIDFQVVDVDYRHILGTGCKYFVNYAVGVRYAKLDQGFSQIGEFAPPTGTILTETDIDFEGAGLRAGLDAEQRLGATRFGVYGKSFINVILGRFRSNYSQFDLTTDSVQALSNWKDERAVPILEYEVGLSWTSYSGRWRFSAGYYTAFWFNAITTPQYVQAVQNADFVNLGDTVTFDGLVSRLEFRY